MDRITGKRGLRRSAKYTLEIALLADGVWRAPMVCDSMDVGSEARLKIGKLPRRDAFAAYNIRQVVSSC
jgi:hypothetical protein